jgi:hypothetical protein
LPFNKIVIPDLIRDPENGGKTGSRIKSGMTVVFVGNTAMFVGNKVRPLQKPFVISASLFDTFIGSRRVASIPDTPQYLNWTTVAKADHDDLCK